MSMNLQVIHTFLPFALALAKTGSGINPKNTEKSIARPALGKQSHILLAPTQVPLACIPTTWSSKILSLPQLLLI